MKLTKLLSSFALCIVLGLQTVYAQGLDFMTTSKLVCENDPVKIINTTPDKEKYDFFWTMPDKQGGQNNGDFDTYFNIASYGDGIVKLVRKDKLTKKAIDSVSKKLDITFYPKPEITIISSHEKAGKMIVCQNVFFTLEAVPTDPTTVMNNMKWKVGLTPYKEGENPMTMRSNDVAGEVVGDHVTFSITDANGCYQKYEKLNYITVKKDVAVSPIVQIKTPTSDWTRPMVEVCESESNYSVQFTTPPGGTSTIQSFEWTLPDGTINTTDKTFDGLAKDFGYKQFSLKVTDSQGCESSKTTVTLSLRDFNAGLDFRARNKDTGADAPWGETQCGGNYIFSPLISADLIKWDLNDDGIYDQEIKKGTSQTSNPALYSENKTITMYAESSGIGCSGRISKALAIEPIADITLVPNKLFACKPEIFNFTVKSNLPDATVSIFDSTFNVTNDQVPANGTYSASYSFGIHKIVMKPTTPAGCEVKTQTIEFEVVRPTLKFDLSQSSNHCIPHVVTFIDSIAYNPKTSTDKIAKYIWNYGDGSPEIEYLIHTPNPSHTYTVADIFNPKLTVVTDSGCAYSFDRIIPVGDKSIINYTLQNTNICAQGEVLYSDFSTDANLIDNISISALPADPKHPFGAGATIYGPPTTGATATLTNFDTLGLHNIYITAEYNECKTYKSDFNVIDIKGPIIRIGKIKTCEMQEDSAYFHIYKKLDATEDIQWSFYECNFKGEIFGNQISASITAPIGDTIPYKFPHAGFYKIAATTINTSNGCQNSDTMMVLIEKMNLQLNLDKSAICLAESVQKIYQEEIYGFTGVYRVENFTLYVQNLDSKDIDTSHISIKTPYAVEELNLNKKGIYQFTLEGHNTAGCPFYVNDYIKVYEPVALIETKDNSGCLPITVTYTNLSTSDTTFKMFSWSTNSDVNPTDTTNLLSETFSAQYSTKLPITTTIIAETVMGCKNTFELKGAVNPIIPGAQFTVTDKICLGTEATITRTEDVATDSIHWRFAPDTIWYEISDLVQTHKYEAEGEYEISLHAGRTTSYGYCTNIETKKVSVKNLYADIIITPPNDKCFKNLGAKNSWTAQNKEAFADVTYNWVEGGLARDSSSGNLITLKEITKPGRYPVTLELVTNYIGCKNLTDIEYADVQGADFDFKLSKSLICVREEFEIQIINTKNLDVTPYTIFFGDGRINTKDTLIKLSYPTVLDVGFYPISIIGQCSNVPIVKNINMYKIESRFVQNGENMPVSGCSPLGVLFTSKSFGQDVQTWSFGNGQTTNVLSPDSVYYTSPGTYTTSLTVENKDCRDIISNTVTVFPNPEMTWAAKDKINCEGNDAYITNAPTTETYTYQWSPAGRLDDPSRVNPTFLSADSTRTFHVTATNTYNCSIKDSVKLTVQNRPHYTGAPKDSISYLRLGEYVKFRPTDTLVVLEKYDLGNDSLANVKYKWTPSTYLSCDTCANPLIAIPDGVEKLHYKVQMTDIYGCFDESAELDFTVIKNTMAALPGAFTPNGDGSNDVLYLRGWAIRQLVELRVYNRLGQLVFETDDINKGWDGTFNGKDQPADTYAYTFKIITFAGEEKFSKGDFKLVR